MAPPAKSIPISALPVLIMTKAKIPSPTSNSEITKAILRPPMKSMLVSGMILNMVSSSSYMLNVR